MKYRTLGATAVKVSELGLGCSSLGNSIFNHGDEKFFLDILNYAYDNGITFYDTADSYSYGNSESLIGKAFSKQRDKVVISTKVGFLPSSLSAKGKYFVPFLGGARKLITPFKKQLKKRTKKRQDFSTDHIRKSIENSLKRLRTDYSDIYLLHNPPRDIIENQEAFCVLDQLRNEGKIRYYGVSAASIDDAILCLAYPGISVLQIEFNLLNREAAKKLFPLLSAREIGIIARVPFARGYLTPQGKVKTGFFNNESASVIQSNEAAANYAKEINKEIFPEAALKFILNYEQVSTTISGTRSLIHLKQNIDAVENPIINNSELDKIFEIYK